MRFVGSLALAALTFLSVPTVLSAQADPSPLNRILRTHRIKDAPELLDYGAVAKNERPLLARFLSSIQGITDERWKLYSKAEQQAFWMNAHLALVLYQIADHYPLKEARIRFFPGDSVQQIEGYWERRFPVRGGEESLRSIEERLVKEFGDVRAVLALFLGARGGPPPPAEAWTATNLAARIDDRLKEYFVSARGARVDLARQELQLSELILDFWKKDVLEAAPSEGVGRARHAASAAALNPRGRTGPWGVYDEETARLLAFLAPYLPRGLAPRLQARKFDVRPLPFDWSLNDGTPPPEPREGIPLEPEKAFEGKDEELKDGEIPIPPYERLPRKPEKELKPGEIKPLMDEKELRKLLFGEEESK